MKSLRIAYLSNLDPRDKTSWSGTHYRMLNSLKEEFDEVIVLGPIKNNLINLIIQIQNVFHILLYGRRFNKLHNKTLARFYAFKIDSLLLREKFDAIVAPIASTEIAFLKTKIPIFYISDTSFGQIQNYYSYFKRLSEKSIITSEHIEKRALKKAKHLIYSSSWAADFVIHHYQVEPKKITIIKFGANLDYIPTKEEIQIKKNSIYNLLFLGVEWERKGGDLAFETLLILLRNNLDVRLTVVGCNPPVSHPNINVINFLDKNNADDSLKIRQLFLDAYLLFLPTRADCTPIVFGEANAYGVPVITTNTGGVNSLIENGINGYALGQQATAEDYANKIIKIIKSPHHYNYLSKMSRKKFEEELNWNFWSKCMKNLIIKSI